MNIKSINLVPVYSKKIRLIFLWLIVLGICLLLVNLLIKSQIVKTNILLWFITFALTIVNFSKLGINEKHDQLARYITLKLSFTYIIGFLMATSFTEIFLKINLPSLKLFTVLSGNIVFIISHYVLYYIISTNNAELHDESVIIFLKNHKRLLLLLVILSIITLIIVYIIL